MNGEGGSFLFDAEPVDGGESGAQRGQRVGGLGGERVARLLAEPSLLRPVQADGAERRRVLREQRREVAEVTPGDDDDGVPRVEPGQQRGHVGVWMGNGRVVDDGSERAVVVEEEEGGGWVRRRHEDGVASEAMKRSAQRWTSRSATWTLSASMRICFSSGSISRANLMAEARLSSSYGFTRTAPERR